MDWASVSVTLGFRIMSDITPREPLARSASVAKFNVTITFIQRAGSILCASIFVPLFFFGICQFHSPHNHLCSMFKGSLASPMVSLVSKMYKMFPVLAQCLQMATLFHVLQTLFLGVMSMASSHGLLVKLGISHVGFVKISLHITPKSSLEQSPSRSLSESLQ